MAEVNSAAAPAVQPIVLGNKLLSPGADGKTVKISEKDGSNAQSMDIEAFKKYLAAHKEEIIAASKQQQSGDTVNFKGREDAEAKPPKKGISTGTALLATAALIGVGVWKKDLVAKYWKQFTGFISKAAKEEKAVEGAVKEKAPAQTLYKEYQQIKGAKETETLDKAISASQARVTPAAHGKREAELVKTIQAFERAEKRNAFELVKATA